MKIIQQKILDESECQSINSFALSISKKDSTEKNLKNSGPGSGVVENPGLKNHLNNESFSIDVELNESIHENEG